MSEDKRISIRVSPADYKKLEKAAGHLGLSIASFARMAMFERMNEKEQTK